MTTSNKLYVLDFQSFFFLANHNVKMHGPYPLSLNGTARCFDKVEVQRSGPNSSQEMRFAIGTTVQDHNLDSVLVFATGDPIKGFNLSRVQVDGAA